MSTVKTPRVRANFGVAMQSIVYYSPVPVVVLAFALVLVDGDGGDGGDGDGGGEPGRVAMPHQVLP